MEVVQQTFDQNPGPDHTVLQALACIGMYRITRPELIPYRSAIILIRTSILIIIKINNPLLPIFAHYC